jgi:hypothetical protein
MHLDYVVLGKDLDRVGVLDHRLVNFCLHVWLGWCGKKDTRVYIGSNGTSLRLVQAAHVLALACSRGYKRSREGMGSQVCGGEVSVRVRDCLESPLWEASPSLL